MRTAIGSVVAALLAACGLASLGAAPDAAAGDADAFVLDAASVELNAKIERVTGETACEPTLAGSTWTCGDMRTGAPLPVAYPRPTPAGVMEIKPYASVRRAEKSGGGDAMMATEGGFWPLFQHISARRIEMTAPVEMDYAMAEAPKDLTTPEGEDAGAGNAAGAGAAPGWRMSFLYRDPTLGPTGTVENGVVVTDTEASTWLSVGVRGTVTKRRIAEFEAQMTEWLAGQTAWRATGERRWLGYNGPDVPREQSWWEVQMRVEKREPAKAAEDGVGG